MERQQVQQHIHIVDVPAVQDGIVIENGTDGNQFVWVPVGEIKNKDNTTNTITLGRYTFNYSTGKETLIQNAKEYQQETIVTVKSQKKQDYAIAKLKLQDNEVKINTAIQLEGILNNAKITTTAVDIPANVDYKELVAFRVGNTATDSTAENATARDLKTFIETSLANGGYYIARFEASGTTEKIESKYNKIVLEEMTQPNAAKVAREMYGEVKENNELIYASDLINSYAWDTAIIFIQTYGTGTDASTYTIQNKSTSFANTGINNDKYCNIWDMSGNAEEWTTEYSNRSSDNYFMICVSRGGDYYAPSGGTSYFTSARKEKSTLDDSYRNGLRSILYAK